MTEGCYLVRLDTGLDPYSAGEYASLANAQAVVERMGSPEGCSRHEAVIYQWRKRAVDGKLSLVAVERYWFGKLVRTEAVEEALRLDRRAQHFSESKGWQHGRTQTARRAARAAYDALTPRERDAFTRNWQELS